MNRICNRIAAAIAAGCASLALASGAHAVDLRDWGRKYDSASERYVVLSQFDNQAVLDRETQLVWQRSVRSAAEWFMARNTCYASGTGGRHGWRLPSLSELSSVGGTGGVLPAGHPFQNVPAGTYFWSTTDWSTGSGRAWSRTLLAPGYIATTSKENTLPHLCVRGFAVEGG